VEEAGLHDLPSVIFKFTLEPILYVVYIIIKHHAIITESKRLLRIIGVFAIIGATYVTLRMLGL